jgi:hypothetical protein
MPWNGSSSFALSPVSAFSNVTQLAPSGDTSGATDTARLNSAVGQLGGLGGAILLAPGVFDWLTASITIDQKTAGPVYLYGAGIEATLVRFHGSGDGLRIFSSKTGGNAYLPGGGGITGITFDGTSVTGPGSSLVHMGDIYNYEVDFAVQNLPPAAGIMAWFDNQYLFTEQLHGRVHVHSGGNPAVQFDNSANLSGNATGSFDRARLEIMLDQKGKGDCVVFANGAFMTDNTGYLTIAGNTDYGAVKYWVLTLIGSNAGGMSRITNSLLNIGVECNGTTGVQPGTIKFGTTGPSGNQIFQCDGLIDFSGNNLFAVSNNDHSFFFTGATYGDNELPSCGPVSDAIFKHGALVNNDTIQTKFFRQVQVTPAANVTGIIMDAFLPDDWRRITVQNNGAGSVTFAAAGTSHVATGAAAVINPNMCQDFEYNPDVNLWYAVQ